MSVTHSGSGVALEVVDWSVLSTPSIFSVLLEHYYRFGEPLGMCYELNIFGTVIQIFINVLVPPGFYEHYLISCLTLFVLLRSLQQIFPDYQFKPFNFIIFYTFFV